MWAKLTDDILDNPKILAAGTLGFLLYVAGILYAARNLTDGFVPVGRVRGLLDLTALRTAKDNPAGLPEIDALAEGFGVPDALKIAAHLAATGLWEKVDGGFQIHEYLDFNPSRETVLQGRGKARERMAKSRGCSDEVQANIGRSSGAPVPVPVPNSRSEEKRRKKRTSSSCSEVGKTHSEPVAVPGFPCIGKGSKSWDLTQEHLAELEEAYPGVDAAQEAIKARQWLRDNPTRRKTARGMRRYIGGWMERAQNRGNGRERDGPRRETPAGPTAPSDRESEELLRKLRAEERKYGKGHGCQRSDETEPT